ncbi:MAG: electron transfer flavoprotein subunit alpha/FixB family protein, partial [Deltaproteobacteria bacterium]
MVLVYSDNKKLGFELLNKGRELADMLNKTLVSVIIGKDDEKDAEEYIYHGVDKVYIAETEHQEFKVEEYTEILINVIQENNCEVVLIGSNKRGKELAPRLAAKLKTGCITDSTNIYLQGNILFAERVVYSGNAVAVEQFNSKPQIIT